jgi:hypothetical protein
MTISSTSSAMSGTVGNEVQAKLFKSANKQQEAVVGKIMESATGAESANSSDRSNYSTGKAVNVKA